MVPSAVVGPGTGSEKWDHQAGRHMRRAHGTLDGTTDIAGLLLFRARECVCGVVEQLGNVSKFGGALQRFFILLVGCTCLKNNIIKNK